MLGLFERLAVDAQASSTLAAFRAKLGDAVRQHMSADSAAMMDPPWGPFEDARNRIAGLGPSAAWVDPFLANRRRWTKSLGRYVRALQHGPAIDSDVYGSRDRGRLAAYVELLLPQGATCMLASSVWYRCRTVALIVLKRHGRSPAFRARDVEALRGLLPAIGLADAGFQYSLGAPGASPLRNAGFGALSPREMQVAQLACKGMRNSEISAILGTSRETIKKQLRSVIEKMDVSNRTELAMVWAGS